jgi:hypothetical protein
MTKDEVLEKVKDMQRGRASIYDVETALDAYTQALLQQSVCKECQKRKLIEIMRDDEQAGLYDR